VDHWRWQQIARFFPTPQDKVLLQSRVLGSRDFFFTAVEGLRDGFREVSGYVSGTGKFWVLNIGYWVLGIGFWVWRKG
jgi:hypothetical protein